MEVLFGLTGYYHELNPIRPTVKITKPYPDQIHEHLQILRNSSVNACWSLEAEKNAVELFSYVGNDLTLRLNKDLATIYCIYADFKSNLVPVANATPDYWLDQAANYLIDHPNNKKVLEDIFLLNDHRQMDKSKDKFANLSTICFELERKNNKAGKYKLEKIYCETGKAITTFIFALDADLSSDNKL